MKITWEYEGKKYVIYDDRDGNLYLNCHLCDCSEILKYIDSPNENVSNRAKYRAKEILSTIEHNKELKEQQKRSEKQKKQTGKMKLSDVVFVDEYDLKNIRRNLSEFDCKEWQYEGQKYIIHYDHKNERIYLNGRAVWNCFDIWFFVDSPNETNSWRAKHKAKEIEIARLESTGVKIDRCEFPEQPLTLGDTFASILVVIAAIALIAGIIYLIYQVWWFFVGYDAFEGPFADQYSAGETTADTIILFIVLIVVIEEVIRRIRNGHF